MKGFNTVFRAIWCAILFLPCYGFSAQLPTHYGSELGVIFSGYIDRNTKKIVTKAIELDISSTKLLNGRMYLTTIGRLGGDATGLGGSVFVKLNDYLYVGGSFLSDHSFDIQSNFTAMLSVETKYGLVEPFVTINAKNNVIPEAGLRTYIMKYASVEASYFTVSGIKNTSYFRLGIKIPLSHELNLLEDLLSFGPKKLDKDKK